MTQSLRIDRWLWRARFLKSRSLAAGLCQSGKLRVNSARVTKPGRPVRVGDVLTFPLGAHIRVVEIKALGTRRGPASEARTLYDDLSPPAPETRMPGGRPLRAGPRPTKKDRRKLAALLDPARANPGES